MNIYVCVCVCVYKILSALPNMWDLSSPSSLTGEPGGAPCIGSMESQLLDRQGTPPSMCIVLTSIPGDSAFVES